MDSLTPQEERSPMPIELTKDNFADIVDKNDIVIVDFWAEWCGPCRAFAPTFEAAAEKHTGVVFGKVDTEAQQELAGTFDIRAIPTLAVFRDQVLLYRQPGAVPADALDDIVEQVKALDMAEVHAEIARQKADASS